MAGIYLSLGTNLNDRIENLRRCLKLIAYQNDIQIEDISSVYKSEPIGFTNQPWFLNLIIKISTNLAPLDLLKISQKLETLTGRKKTFRWGPRIIDIDIIDYNNTLFDHQKLRLPHQQLHMRRFVLIPLREVAENYFHPEIKKNIDQLLAECPDKSQIKWYKHGKQLLANET